MSLGYVCVIHKIQICDCYGNVVRNLEAERDRLQSELANVHKASDTVDRERTQWQAKAERYEHVIEKIRALPERADKCLCFNITQKALRTHDEKGKE